MKAGVRWTPCETQKTAVSKREQNEYALHWLFKPFECDGLISGAGDGTRTRDSLLGKQVAAVPGALPWDGQKGGPLFANEQEGWMTHYVSVPDSPLNRLELVEDREPSYLSRCYELCERIRGLVTRYAACCPVSHLRWWGILANAPVWFLFCHRKRLLHEEHKGKSQPWTGSSF